MPFVVLYPAQATPVAARRQGQVHHSRCRYQFADMPGLGYDYFVIFGSIWRARFARLAFAYLLEKAVPVGNSAITIFPHSLESGTAIGLLG